LGPYRPCYECGAYPLQGARFECITCLDANVCVECDAKESHPKNHLLMKTFFPERKISQVPMTTKLKADCIMCSTEIYLPGIFYQTERFPVLCKNCLPPNEKYWTLQVPPESLISKERLGRNPRGAICDVRLKGCLQSCTGINWKCVRCFDFDICENCQVFFEDPTFIKKVKCHSRECAIIKIYYAECCFWTNWKHSGIRYRYHEEDDSEIDPVVSINVNIT